jgi:hypothetical protein
MPDSFSFPILLSHFWLNIWPYSESFNDFVLIPSFFWDSSRSHCRPAILHWSQSHWVVLFTQLVITLFRLYSRLTSAFSDFWFNLVPLSHNLNIKGVWFYQLIKSLSIFFILCRKNLRIWESGLIRFVYFHHLIYLNKFVVDSSEIASKFLCERKTL